MLSPEPEPSPAATPRKYDDWQPSPAQIIKGDTAVADAADRLKKRLDALKAKSAASVYDAGGAYDGVKGEPSFASMSSSEDASSIRDEVPQNDIGDLVLEDAGVSREDAGDVAPPGGAREAELATRSRPG